MAPPTEPKLVVTGVLTMVLLGPANWPDLNPREILCCIVKRKMRDTRPNHKDKVKAAIKANLGFHNTTAEPWADHLDAHAPIDEEICSKVF